MFTGVEIVVVGVILIFLFNYIGAFSFNTFVQDNRAVFDKLKEEGGGCRSEGLLRLVNQKGAGFRFLITPVGLFQKSPCACSVPPFTIYRECRRRGLLRSG